MTSLRRILRAGAVAFVLLAVAGPLRAAGPEAVEFAKRDVERARHLVEIADQQVRAASESPEFKAVAAATAEKKTADAELTRAVAELQQAEAARKSATGNLASTKEASTKAAADVEAAAKALVAATAAKVTAESRRTAVEAAVALAEADLTAAVEAEVAARKLLVAGAKRELAAAEAEVAKAVASEEQATSNVAAAKSARTAAEKTVAEAGKSLEAATARVSAATAKQKAAKARVDQVAKRVAEVTKSSQPAVEAKKQADAAAAEARTRLATVSARLARVEKKATPDPKAVREVAKATFGRPAISVRIDPTGTHWVTGLQDKTLHRQDVLTAERTPLEGHRTWVRRLALSRGGELLVSGDYSGTLAWWDPNSSAPKPTRIVEAHEGYVRGVAVSPDDRFVASGGNDGFVRVWDASTGERVAEMDGHQHLEKVAEYADTPERVFVNHVYNVAFDPTGKYLVSGDLIGVVKVWEVGSWKPVRDLDASPLHGYDKTFRAHCGGIRGMDFSPDGKLLAACGIGEVTNAFAGVGKPTGCVYEVETGKRLTVLKPAANFQGACWSIRFHPSGEWLVGAGGGGSGSLWFWKPTEAKSFHAFKTPHVAYDVDFHPDGLRMAVALYDKTVRLYDLLPAEKPAAEPAK